MKNKFSNNILFRFFREAIIELKKVVWPTKKEVFKKTTTVVISLIVIAIIVGAIDFGLSELIKVLINLV
uniref:Protein translocase subunit SecE n=1 Tax=candidate division CPR3 bacterium TaxID=2268181 RepID=A0A7C4LZJ5_UNCC3